MFSKLALVATILAAAAQADVGAWGQCEEIRTFKRQKGRALS
jgi:hypothetical protein